MCFFLINNYYKKLSIKYLIIINLKKQKKSVLTILNNLLNNFYLKTKVSKEENFKNKIMFKYYIPLLFHTKYIYYKKYIHQNLN